MCHGNRPGSGRGMADGEMSGAGRQIKSEVGGEEPGPVPESRLFDEPDEPDEAGAASQRANVHLLSGVGVSAARIGRFKTGKAGSVPEEQANKQSLDLGGLHVAR